MRPFRHLCLAATTALCLWAALATPAAAQGSRPAPAADSARFDILEYVVEGDTVLGAAAIERAVYAFLGLQRSLDDAEAARKALEAAYHAAGFLSVSVLLPVQRIEPGVSEVRLQVVQAPIERLRITGAEYTLPSRLREALPNLKAGSVPNFNEMQEELADAARANPQAELTPLIAAGSAPGTLQVELKVQDKAPYQASLALSNKQSQNTEAGRLEASLSWDNLFQRGHSFGWSWFYSPKRPAQANIQTFTYHLPLGRPDSRLFLSLQHSDSDTPTPLGGSAASGGVTAAAPAVIGGLGGSNIGTSLGGGASLGSTVSRGETWRLRWRHGLGGIGTGAGSGLQHAMSLGLALRNLRDRNQGIAGFDTDLPTLRYPILQAGYELYLNGSTPGRSSRLLADLTLGVPALSRRMVDCFGVQKDQFACKRAAATPGFQVLSLTLGHREPFGAWALDTRVQAQYSDAPLVPSEQFSFGGVDSVRGFHDGEVSTDLGAALRLELLAPAWQPLVQLSLKPLLFYDHGFGRRLEALASEQSTQQLASAGLGLRLESPLGTAAALTWAHVLRGTGRSQRLDFSLSQSF